MNLSSYTRESFYSLTNKEPFQTRKPDTFEKFSFTMSLLLLKSHRKCANLILSENFLCNVPLLLKRHRRHGNLPLSKKYFEIFCNVPFYYIKRVSIIENLSHFKNFFTLVFYSLRRHLKPANVSIIDIFTKSSQSISSHHSLSFVLQWSFNK